MSALELWRELGHEQVELLRDRATGLVAIVAIHDTTLGPAVGGTRMRSYAALDDALDDALRLSRAMTYKAALADLPYGGAKAVIVGDPARDKRPELLIAYARAVDRLRGRFVSGGDMGIDPRDVEILARHTPVFPLVPPGASVGPSDLTAIGVREAVREVARRLGHGLDGLHVALQGLGEVGARLARLLHAAGARLTVTDVDFARVARAVEELGAAAVAPDLVYDVECDVFSPNAAGGVIDDATLPRLRCRAVVGAANEQLRDARHAEALAARGILHAPDFVANAGGIISLLFEQGVADETEVIAHTRRIGERLREILDRAAAEGAAPERVAERLAQERVAAARGH
jgi:leucine dehydrogenase